MTKKEFLEQLEDALVGEVPNSVVYDNKQYYSKYIDAELWKGRMEEEILEELGNPRLLAKTIIDIQEGRAFSDSYDTVYENYKTVGEEDNKAEQIRESFFRGGRLTGILVGVIGIFFLFFVVRLISGIALFVIYYAWPVLLAYILWILGRYYLKK